MAARASSRRLIVAVLCAASAGACVTTQMGGTRLPDGRGFEGGTLAVGERRYDLTECRSGDLEYFLGVDLADAGGEAVVRFLIDPITGPRLRVVLREGGRPQVLVLERAACPQLDADLRPTGWRINTVRDFSGSLDAECTAESGPDVRVHVRFAHCH
jgi:hypothetical protein